MLNVPHHGWVILDYLNESETAFFTISSYLKIYLHLIPQLLWLEMALFSKKALRNIEKHS